MRKKKSCVIVECFCKIRDQVKTRTMLEQKEKRKEKEGKRWKLEKLACRIIHSPHSFTTPASFTSQQQQLEANFNLFLLMNELLYGLAPRDTNSKVPLQRVYCSHRNDIIKDETAG